MFDKIMKKGNLQTAFSRVQASHGMAGVDGISIREFSCDLNLNLSILVSELYEGRYMPLPLLRFLVAKKDGLPRILTVPCVSDRVVQAGALNIIESVFEYEFEDVSYAYRKGRSIKQAVHRILELREQGYRYVVETDIDSYFDNIDHELLISKVGALISDERVLKLIEKWIRAEVYDGSQVYKLEKGIPQGSVISPMLANLFLDEFDEAMINSGFQLVRYSDDFIVLSKTCGGAEKALELTESKLKQLRLSLDEEDTHITVFEDGFRFLGVTFLNDSAFVPFDRGKREKKILYMPPPFDLAAYLSHREEEL